MIMIKNKTPLAPLLPFYLYFGYLLKIEIGSCLDFAGTSGTKYIQISIYIGLNRLLVT